MQIRKMNATFGKLKNDTLTLQPGLNCIYAPNESGKSTWSHFLRVMLYGINTRDRGALADKNRFAPWAGWAMGGSMDIVTDAGEAVTLRRDTVRQNAPMGEFSCSYTDTATQMAGITKDNAGEILLGVGQEVFVRSAFIRHSALVVDKDTELERRIAALISSGEEDISYSEVNTRLKKQLNRRRHNKTGLLPQLEAELASLQTQLRHMEDLQRQHGEAQRLVQQYETEVQALSEQQALWKLRTLQDAARKYVAAEEAAEQASARTALLREAYPSLPDERTLSALEGRMAALQMAAQRGTQAQEALTQAKHQWEDARRAWENHPLFPDSDEALQTRRDAVTAPKMPAALWWVIPVALALGCGTATYFYLQQTTTPLFAAAVLSGVAALGSVIALLWRSKKVRQLQTDAAAKLAALEQQIAEYLPLRQHCVAAQQEVARCDLAAEGVKQQLLGELTALLSALRPYAAAEDAGGAQMALNTLRQQLTRLQKAADEEERAAIQRDVLLHSLPEGAQDVLDRPPAEPSLSREMVAQRLPQALSMVQSARSRLDTLTGQLRSMGEEDALRFRLREKEEQRALLQEEYDAVALAMEVLDEANVTLQNRFSPALGTRAAEIFRHLTAGRYEKVLLSRDFSLETEEGADSAARSVQLLSQGAADQLYLAVRLAICDMVLPEDKTVPLVLDDALLSFDEARLHAALDYLVEVSQKRQILLFSCQKREQEYLQGRENVTLLTL